MFSRAVSLLSGAVMPAVLLLGGAVTGGRLGFFWLRRPASVVRDALGGPGRSSSLQALSVALAGTLGVGNIAGVATALLSGGAGALFWMWVGAIASVGVKYTETYLAVAHRRIDPHTGKPYGGAMYYLADLFPGRWGTVLGRIFAVLCLANAFLTGTAVQVNAAAAASEALPGWIVGAVMALAALPVHLGGGRRVSTVCRRLIPVLTAGYVMLCVAVLCRYRLAVPAAVDAVFREAFSVKAAVGGFWGLGITRGIRYGMVRGMFSNESGCGTSPTAHATAEDATPHGQGCVGILEVWIDTPILCTLTALVLLIAFPGGFPGGTGIGLAAESFVRLMGPSAGVAVRAAVLLFAYATVICQGYYGRVALRFLGGGARSCQVLAVMLALASVICVFVPESGLWLGADLLFSVMTVLNVAALLVAGGCKGVPLQNPL